MGGRKSRAEDQIWKAALGKLRAVLESQRDVGASSYPVVVTRLFELAGEPPDEPAMRKLVNPTAEKVLRVTAKQGRGRPIDHFAQALAFLPDDKERVADSPALLEHALRRAKSDQKTARTDVFTDAQLAEALPGWLRAAFRSALKRRLEAREGLSGAGAVRIKGKWFFFLFEDALGCQPARIEEPVASLESAARTTPTNGKEAGIARSHADFAARFEHEFERLDRASGGHNYVLLHDLRHALDSFDRDEFDAYLKELRVAKRFTLDSPEGRHVRLSPEQLEAGIREGNSLLVYVARR